MTNVASPAESVIAARSSRLLIAAVRVAVALLWMQNVGWKTPPQFGNGSRPSGLYQFTTWAVEYPVFAPYTWLVEHVVLPNFAVFGWLVMLAEGSLAAFLLVGLATRLWALVGVGQTLAIALSVLNAPHEWHWSYFLMVLVHLLLFATAAGRYYGVDGVLRPGWQRSANPVARTLGRLS
ncbi:MAG: DoxX family membrane protein [Streptosporangiales bacterium]|nr:DoxX family membrane protein [Streptosporangiales bacterium]